MRSAQVEYSEDPGTLYYFRYPVADSAEGEHLPVATTRPETILGDTAVAVHPEVLFCYSTSCRQLSSCASLA